MKCYLTLLVVFALVASVFAGTPINPNDGRDCGRKNPNMLNAIGKFCQNRSLMVPSFYATSPMYADKGPAYVRIEGSCQPQQWVPWEWCFKQMYNTCKNGNNHGAGFQRYGNGGCQKFTTVTW